MISAAQTGHMHIAHTLPKVERVEHAEAGQSGVRCLLVAENVHWIEYGWEHLGVGGK